MSEVTLHVTRPRSQKYSRLLSSYVKWVTSFGGWQSKILTLKVAITTAADDIHKYFSMFSRENKT